MKTENLLFIYKEEEEEEEKGEFYVRTIVQQLLFL